jgi:hypothetical protein
MREAANLWLAAHFEGRHAVFLEECDGQVFIDRPRAFHFILAFKTILDVS